MQWGTSATPRGPESRAQGSLAPLPRRVRRSVPRGDCGPAWGGPALVPQRVTQDVSLAMRRGQDLVVGAAVVEMRLLGGLPAAEQLVDGEGVDLREILGVRRQHLRVARAQVVLRGDLLAFVGIQPLQVG